MGNAFGAAENGVGIKAISLKGNVPPGQEGAGSGRLVTLEKGIGKEELVRCVTRQLGLEYGGF